MNWLKSKGLDELAGAKARRLIDDEGQLVIDWNLSIAPITLKAAKEFVRRHHRHCQPPAGWRYGAGIANGRELIGVVMVGRPVARMLDSTSVVEVNRLCINPDLAEGLQWNACSLGYAWAAREAKRRGFTKIITYTLETESGTSLKAAGWHVEHRSAGGVWNRPSRERAPSGPTCAKLRWSPSHSPRNIAMSESSMAHTIVRKADRAPPDKTPKQASINGAQP